MTVSITSLCGYHQSSTKQTWEIPFSAMRPQRMSGGVQKPISDQTIKPHPTPKAELMMNLEHLEKRIPVLTEHDAAEHAAWAYRVKDEWSQINMLAPAYILGTAAYLETEWETYTRKARASNPLIQEGLGDVHGKIIDALRSEFDADFITDERFSLPGLHIFMPSPFFRARFGSCHFDRQWQILDLSPYTGIDTSSIISFTLPLEIPVGGAGLLLWTDKVDPEYSGPVTPGSGQGESICKRVEYQIGELVIHDGWHLHEIAPFKSDEGELTRMTIQGHAIKCDRGWIVHW